MPTCEIITIGSELLDGSVLNTNAQFLAKRVTELDVEVTRQISCRDRNEEIVNALSLAYRHSDLIFVTGGLGPTPDDITREAIAKFFGCKLKFDPMQYQHIVQYFRKLGSSAPLITRREAFFPEVAKPLLNRFGIALGFYTWQEGILLVVLPGVPRELVGMYHEKVHKLIEQKLKNRKPIYRLEARIAGLYETQIMRKLGTEFFKNRKFDFGIYPEIGEVAIRIKARGKKLITVLRAELKERLEGFLFSFDEELLASVIGKKLLRRKKTLSVAESCTGGLLAKEITDCPGASRYFKGGVIAYSNSVKVNELQVSSELIRKKGAVSKEVAKAMANGIRFKYQTSFGISITGIAGPGGKTPKKALGLVYLSISDSERNRVFKIRFSGDRSKIRLQAVRKALFFLWKWIRKQ